MKKDNAFPNTDKEVKCKMLDIMYGKDNFYFIYRVSALIFNKDKTKI